MARAIAHFFAWWISELAFLLPAPLRHWWTESDRVVFLSFDTTGCARFEGLRHGKRDTLVSIKPSDYESSHNSAGLHRDLTRHMSGSYQVFLCLAGDQTLRRIVQLPLAAAENLRQTLAYEIDRYIPFKADQIYFDHRVLDRDTAQSKLTIELVVAKQAVVDQSLARASLLGVKPSGVIPFDDNHPSLSSLNLMPDSRSTSTVSLAFWVRLVFAAIALTLAATWLAIPVWQKRAAAISLLSPLAEAKLAASETDKLRERLDKMVAQHNQLPDRKWHDHSLLAVFAEVSKLLPDDSFVTALDYDGKTVQIQGEAASAAGLVEVLDASPLFKDVGFKASVAKIKGATGERFHISATLDSGARPIRPANIPATAPQNDIAKDKL